MYKKIKNRTFKILQVAADMENIDKTDEQESEADSEEKQYCPYCGKKLK